MRAALILPLIAAVLGMAARGEEPVFYRGININGPALVIDGQQWEAGNAPGVANKDVPFENQSVPLQPPVDEARARMLRSSTYQPNGKNRVVVREVPPGTYTVFLHAWEDNDSQRFDVFLNGDDVARGLVSGPAGTWQRLGPWVVSVEGGEIAITSEGGHANFSGIEIWRGVKGQAPERALTREEVDFFEGKIRPVLAGTCYECHSVEGKKAKGGLLVDSRAGLLKGGDSGPAIVPGDPEKSLLIRAVRHADKDLAMPPKKKIADHQIAALSEWVKMGAPDPRTGAPKQDRPDAFDWEKERQHWAYRTLHEPAVPEVKDEAWAASEIDRFIFAKLEEKGLQPVGVADKRTLLRRVTHNLTGLPPTPEEMAAFLADESEEAWERVVDRLLASRHYGERWGRHWMDLVRYADTAGDNSDYPVPQLWRYRNYVIDSFNADKPYDQFIREQIAGDLLPAKDQAQRNEQVIATGYIALARRFGSVVDLYPQHLTIEDTLENMGRTFLGLGLSCARCHDHKFDAISQRDYYALYGIFESTRYAFPGIELLKIQKDFVPLVSKEEIERMFGAHREQEKELQKKHDAVAAARRALEEKEKQLRERIEKAPVEEKPALDKELAALHQEIERERANVRRAAEAIERHKRNQPRMEDAYAVQDGTPRDAKIQLKGEPNRLGEQVPRRFLQVLGGQPLPEKTRKTNSGRRELAEWIADPKNPLTARVMVNRVWQYHFGAGLVRTPNDFGVRGLPPANPELLDWLAHRLIADGWSLKRLHKRILLSRVYRLSSGDDARNLAMDPNNQWHWRANRLRLDAEALRDKLLAISGQLDPSPLCEPHPFPPREKWDFTQHHPFKAKYPSKRRSVYLMTARLNAMPFFQAFDGPDRNASTARRDSSVTTVQALYFLNDEFVHEQAGHFADRLLREAADDSGRIDRAFALALHREPTDEEREQLADFLANAHNKVDAKGDPAKREHDVWASLSRALFRTNEFLYVD